jgi:hypothetical protein
MQRSHGLCLPFCCSLPTHTTLRRAIAVVIQGLCSSSRVVRWGGAREGLQACASMVCRSWA